MFILRRVLNDTFISNILIGNKYSLCFKSEFLDDFNKIVESRKLHDIKDKIFAFVINKNKKTLKMDWIISNKPESMNPLLWISMRVTDQVN